MKALVTTLIATSFLFLSSFAVAQYETKPMEPTTQTLTVLEGKFLVLPDTMNNFQGDLNELTGKTVTFEGKTLTIETAKWSPDCKIILTFQKVNSTMEPEGTFDVIKDSSGKLFSCPQTLQTPQTPQENQ